MLSASGQVFTHTGSLRRAYSVRSEQLGSPMMLFQEPDSQIRNGVEDIAATRSQPDAASSSPAPHDVASPIAGHARQEIVDNGDD